MGLDDTSPRTLRSKIARAAVLLSSGSLAALLVGRSGQGCGDPPVAEAPKPASTPVAAPQAAQPAPAEPAPVQPARPADASVATPPTQPPPAADAAPSLTVSPGPEDSKNNAGPRYFPASKAGVFIEREPTQQQAPQQQAGPR